MVQNVVEESILLDRGPLTEVEALVNKARAWAPPTIELRVDPAQDYPGQQFAIDIWAPTRNDVTAVIAAVRHNLPAGMAMAVASEVDARTTAAGSATSTLDDVAWSSLSWSEGESQENA